MTQTRLTVAAQPRHPLNAWSKLDDHPRQVVHLHVASVAQLAALGVDAAEATLATTAVARGVSSFSDLGVAPATLSRLRRGVLLPGDARLFITRVVPAAGRIMSGQPFALRVSFAAGEAAAPALVSVAVEWDGEPFVVEQRVDAEAAARGFIDVDFDEEQTLPPGRALFRVTLWSLGGAESRYRTMCAVLPSNPFSADLSPAVHFVTGTKSARAWFDNNVFTTNFNLTLSNGGDSEVTVERNFHWKFWDGGVGGALIEEGDMAFDGSVHVGGHDTANWVVTFISPEGSGVYNKFHDREDLTIEIIVHKKSGGDVKAHIPARTMFHFGVNITRVAKEDFDSHELEELHDAADVLRHIYEKRDVTLRFDFRWILKKDAGGFRTITTDQEAADLCDAWSGPKENDNIDCFVVNLFSEPAPDGGCYDGVDPSIPGPASHDGPNSGVVLSKIGCGDNSIDKDYLGMVMAHELGHYLGLCHCGSAGCHDESDCTDNLMLSNSSESQTRLTYNQYRKIIQHPWMKLGA